jgi:hypothetical protein
MLEGHYFLELKIREDAKPETKPQNRAAVRVGLCRHDYNPTFPLGREDSLAYKSADGRLIH